MKFFRIITTDITSRSKLSLPDKFVERHGANMPTTVSLKVPSGAEWRVELKKKDDGFWFGKGLFEFAESLGLKYGHFFMFDYVDVDVFHVVVIDTSAVEVHYPPALTIFEYGQRQHHQGACPASDPHYNSKRPKLEQVEEGANLDAAPAPLHKYPRKTVKASDTRRTGLMDHTTIAKGTFGREIILNYERRIQCVIQGRRWNDTSSEKVVAKAKAFKADEPCASSQCDQLMLGKRQLFPQCFVKEYFNLSNKFVTLQTNDGKTWSVEYRLAEHKQSLFTYGWKQFVVDNCLRSGDACLFELIRGAENALKVVIFRSVVEPSTQIASL